MLSGVVGKRYAEALFSIAKDANELDRVENELDFVVSSIEQTPEFQEFLLHPKVDLTAKKSSLESVFGPYVSERVLNFLKLLLDNGRETYLSEIQKQFIVLADQERRVIRIHLETPFEMTQEELLKLGTQLHHACGKQVNLTSSLNPGLIGGILVRLGDKVIDASVKGMLHQFRESLQRHQVS